MNETSTDHHHDDPIRTGADDFTTDELDAIATMTDDELRTWLDHREHRSRRRTRTRIAVMATSLLTVGLVLAICGPPRALLPRAIPHYPTISPRPVTEKDRLGYVLAKQAAALLRGDETGYLAAVDPTQPALVARYRDEYRALRGLRVTRWVPLLAGAGRGKYYASFGYCLADTACASNFDLPHTGVTLTVADRAGNPIITAVAAPPPDFEPRYPAPWQTGPLVVFAGHRVIIAAPPALAETARSLIGKAEAAATVADRYAYTAPATYVVYLAAKNDWKTWYAGAGSKARDTAGYETQLTSTVPTVVLRTPLPVDADMLLRHELGHAATINGADRLIFTDMWLVEGIAEYIAFTGRPTASTPRIGGVRKYLRSGHWSGDITLPEWPFNGASPDDNAMYGLAHLAVTCIADTYGETAITRLFAAVVRNGQTVEGASPATLGVSWPDANAHCSRWIGEHVR